MKRAAIIIGVDRTGDLPVLSDAARGARRVERWARSQKIDAIEVLTDESGGVVEARDVKRAVRKIVDAGTYDQLLVYFAGHGVNIAYSEYWLLSGAPSDTQEAINVASSENLARYCGIPHVMLISDACRTAAEGVRAQRVTGSEVFPNDAIVGEENPVDQLRSCTLGRPALEVRDPLTSAREFTALYTVALVDGLGGQQADLLEWTKEGDADVALVRPRPLKNYLSVEVPRRLATLDLTTKPIQVPDGRIISDGTWIAMLKDIARGRPSAADPLDTPSLGRTRGPRPTAGTSAPAETPVALSTALLDSVLGSSGTRFQSILDGVRTAPIGRGADIARTVDATVTSFGATHHDTECGLKVRGARFVRAFSASATLTPFQGPSDVVRVESMREPGASVLLELESGRGVVLPVLPGFLTALTFEDAELVDVAYEPSDNTALGYEYRQRAEEMRSLRAVAAASTRSGVFRLETEQALEIARRMQFSKGIDPALAVYAAYAYHDLQRPDLLREMSGYMRSGFGGCLFDVALLARELEGSRAGSSPTFFGFVPLLAQGWALLSAYRVTLPESLRGLRDTMLPSVWTMFDAAGVQIVRAALAMRDVR
jgi:hypothetical protein